MQAARRTGLDDLVMQGQEQTLEDEAVLTWEDYYYDVLLLPPAPSQKGLHANIVLRNALRRWNASPSSYATTRQAYRGRYPSFLESTAELWRRFGLRLAWKLWGADEAIRP
ncbi:hypothetical protein JX265_002128 [Neoarthrinium moseri]|uniref:Uncharacterized protein n=1 Tax=Neoarthrinium moseri TaxID=1658444 RepID=A0A9Q0AQ54_9PEZI|nr:uncharacterized protein JN550_001790 [Neoarthrinium moseri]KAI1876294.1 hypothetical protein JN550_001790 [Neoarthrinium moseri]KAI1879174.1 hypothetical protein JX265_002128 [Neoarthrinium moseri]